MELVEAKGNDGAASRFVAGQLVTAWHTHTHTHMQKLAKSWLGGKESLSISIGGCREVTDTRLLLKKWMIQDVYIYFFIIFFLNSISFWILFNQLLLNSLSIFFLFTLLIDCRRIIYLLFVRFRESWLVIRFFTLSVCVCVCRSTPGKKKKLKNVHHSIRNQYFFFVFPILSFIMISSFDLYSFDSNSL